LVRQATQISVEEAAALVRSDSWIDYGFGLGQPDLFDAALADRRAGLHGVKIRSGVTMRPRAVLESDPAGDHFLWFNWHFSGYDRKHHDLGRCTYIPMNFGEAPDYYRRFIDPVDLVCLKTAPIDADGYFNMGPSASYQRAIVERAKIVVVETCRSVPRAIGPGNGLHVSEVDYVIDGGADPLPQLPAGVPGDCEIKIAAQIAGRIEDGACLQVGIGALPNAVCGLLKDTNLRDLGIHTEMLVDGMVDLIEAGIVTNARKSLDPGFTAYSFAAGSERLYRMIDGNPLLKAYAVDYTNLPSQIALNDKVVSVNNTTEIDLQGQASSESSGSRHISGTGGQLQFVRGAYSSRGGQSFLCLTSIYEKHGERKSRIVPQLTPGSIVTTPRTDTMFVVTEWGMVNLKGKSVAERALALISVAHPDFREELEREARENNMIPKGFY